MKHAFYITGYNDPESAKALLEDLAFLKLRETHDCFFADQSDEQFRGRYAELCKEHGFEHIRRMNRGANDAKRFIVKHAHANKYPIMSQISEDFRLTTPETCHPAAPCGRDYFLKDAIRIVEHFQHIDFVNWTFFRMGAYNQGWGVFPPMTLHRFPGITLSWMEGNVALFNWPYTGRVDSLMHIHGRADRIIPGTPEDQDLHERTKGEWAQAFVSRGRGVILMAHPVEHTNRVRPEGSIA